MSRTRPNIYAIRPAILRAYKAYRGSALTPGVAITAQEMVDISADPAIRHDPEQALEECAELQLMGYLEPLPGWGGKYLQITGKGLEQLSPEYPRDVFVYGPDAAIF